MPERLVRPLVVVYVTELVEASLLAIHRVLRRTRRFGFECAMHRSELGDDTVDLLIGIQFCTRDLYPQEFPQLAQRGRCSVPKLDDVADSEIGKPRQRNGAKGLPFVENPSIDNGGMI